jgi:patatin-related protein
LATREKELRLALVCYGGISLAVYMHGVTKDIWHLARASRAEHDGAPPLGGVADVYRQLLAAVEQHADVQLRVLVDIVAGASAGGINGIFLSRAIATGESLDPLTDLWLSRADVEVLLDPDARPWSRFTKWWAVPLAWLVSRAPKNTIDTTVERTARAEVRRKLSQFVRARWFAPPFGGEVFSGLLLDAFDAMAAGPKGPVLVPSGHPIDLMVTVTDFAGHGEVMHLNSPAAVEEMEHRLTFAFRHNHGAGGGSDMPDTLADTPGLAFAARATASFPGAFPPFTAREMDRVLTRRRREWPDRAAFLTRQLRGAEDGVDMADRVLVDGSVLANAPFRPAVSALKQRPARREVDRRFVYIDPKPGKRSISLTGKAARVEADGTPALPGFFAAIFRTMSDIPREQPIRDNVETIEGLSQRIRRMQRIVAAMTPEVEERIEAAVGRNFFLDSPTVARLAKWRAAAQTRAVMEAGYGYVAYGHLKLSLVVEELAMVAAEADGQGGVRNLQGWRGAMWGAVRGRGLDRIETARSASGAAMVTFLRTHDLGFRIRRLRHLARRLDEVAGVGSGVAMAGEQAMRNALYRSLGLYLDRETRAHFAGLAIDPTDLADAGPLIDRIGERRGLMVADTAAEALLVEGFAALPKEARRALLFAYLGYAFYDAATLPLLQGEGQGEFDPIKIDRISPEDADRLRQGGVDATLKGIQFNSFGAFFSRRFRENDYLWGRLHAAERLITVVASAVPPGRELPAEVIAGLQDAAFRAILDEEAERLTTVPELVAELRGKSGG